MIGRFTSMTDPATLCSEQQPGNEMETAVDFPVIPGIDLRDGLQRAGGRRRVYTRLLYLFQRTHRDDLKKLRDLLMQEDWEAARRLVHTLKGTAGNIGARRLYRVSRQVEKDLAGHVGDLGIDALERELLKVVEGIAQWLGTPEENPEPPAVIGIPWDAWSGIMVPLLRQGNIRATAVLPLLSRDVRGKAPGRFDELAEKLSQYCFEDALEILEALDATFGCDT